MLLLPLEWKGKDMKSISDEKTKQRILELVDAIESLEAPRVIADYAQGIVIEIDFDLGIEMGKILDQEFKKRDKS